MTTSKNIDINIDHKWIDAQLQLPEKSGIFFVKLVNNEISRAYFNYDTAFRFQSAFQPHNWRDLESRKGIYDVKEWCEWSPKLMIANG